MRHRNRIVGITIAGGLLLTVAVLSIGIPAAAVGEEQAASGQEPVVGLPCEGCKGVFVGMPETIPAAARIAPIEAPGDAMRISGFIIDNDDNPIEGVIVYAYQTDRDGIYSDDPALHRTPARRHGSFRGWARSDDQGRYEFNTIRPGGYPGRGEPEHVHLHIIEPGRCTYYIAPIEFEDDPRMTPRKLEAARTNARGGIGVSMPVRDSDGAWVVERDIVLGRWIDDYPAR